MIFKSKAVSIVFFISGFGLISADIAEVKKKTLPAYSIALNRNLLNDLSVCKKYLELFHHAVDSQKLWALKILDASGQVESGFLYGNNFLMGSKVQCLDAGNRDPLRLNPEWLQNNSRYRKVDEEFPPFEVNYFSATIRHNSTLQYHTRLPQEDSVYLGLCLPSSCTEDELECILTRIFQERTLTVAERLTGDFSLISVRNVKDNYDWVFNWRVIAVGIVVILSVMLVVLGTCYDLLIHQRRLKMIKYNQAAMSIVRNTSESSQSSIRRQSSPLGRIILCWSAYTNSIATFSTKLHGDSITAIHGLKFLTMLCIILFHTVFYKLNYTNNTVTGWRLIQSFPLFLVGDATITVDTYFVISGILLASPYFKNSHKKVRDNPVNNRNGCGYFFGALVKRIIRLTPAYMIILGITEVVSTKLTRISSYHMSERADYNCAHYWWRNLLYVNNLFSANDVCMLWSWYLSNDMQFFIIGTLLLMMSGAYFYASATLLASLMLLSIFISGSVSYFYNYTPTLDNLYNNIDVVYTKPWMRINPYLIGIATAYILMKLRGKLDLKRRNLCLLWLLGIACNTFVFFGLTEKNISVTATAVYVALSRTVWGIGIAWTVIACVTNNGGIVNRILSLRVWIPLSKLTYCAYLLNPLIIFSIHGTSDVASRFDALPNFISYVGFVTVTYICSYFAHLCFEVPYILLLKVMKQPKI